MEVRALTIEDQVIIPKCRLAVSFLSRFMGLMGKRGIGPDEALLFPKCNSVHTFFMRFPIDVVFVSQEGVVVDIVESMRPWRMLVPRMKARHAVELAGERARALGIKPGTRLACRGVFA